MSKVNSSNKGWGNKKSVYAKARQSSGLGRWYKWHKKIQQG